MADTESRVGKLETRVTSLEQQVSNVSTKLDMFIEESRAARERQDNEMRDFRAKHDEDMREMREDMRNLRSEISNLGNYFRATNITVIIGVAAMVIAVLLK